MLQRSYLDPSGLRCSAILASLSYPSAIRSMMFLGWALRMASATIRASSARLRQCRESLSGSSTISFAKRAQKLGVFHLG